MDLAAKHYEEVLRLAEVEHQKHSKNDDGIFSGEVSDSLQRLDLSKEAAYNLSSIYFTRNAPDLAREVVDKYLSI